jgi:hypothetical protein
MPVGPAARAEGSEDPAALGGVSVIVDLGRYRPQPGPGGAMTLDLARWQFAITTVYHFLFVPLTIGLSLLVAGIQTAWVRTGDERYLRMTKFWGKLLLINFAMGVVTGIVQEFQFGNHDLKRTFHVGIG